MIYKQCVLTIANNTATLDEDVYLYRLDKNVEIYFTIVNNKYKFDKSDLNNIITTSKASYFQLRLYKNAEVKYTFAIQPTDNGQAILTITDDLIDEPIEVGDYDFQISLLDKDKSSMISMPIVSEQIHVCEPLVTDASETGTAVLGLSTLETTGEIVDAFDENGNYIRKVHVNGELISAELFNKWETALETNTKNIAQVTKKVNNMGQGGTSGPTTADNITIKDTNNHFTSTNVEGALDELFQSASNGKQLIATAITGKGVATNPSDSFQTMATNISKIETTPQIKTYTIKNNLTYCSNGNPATTINEGNSYTCKIIAQSGYVISTVSVSMGGTDITNSVYSNGVITINRVTGNIVITVVCTIKPDKEVGTVDSSNDITLSGLSAGNYTLKYESDSGILEDYADITTMEVV